MTDQMTDIVEDGVGEEVGTEDTEETGTEDGESIKVFSTRLFYYCLVPGTDQEIAEIVVTDPEVETGGEIVTGAETEEETGTGAEIEEGETGVTPETTGEFRIFCSEIFL